MSGEEIIHCDLCGRPMPTHDSYVVQINVFADPSMPAMSGEELAKIDVDQTFETLFAQMEGMTGGELQDQVHRHFEFRLCPNCHANFLSNPLGRPRASRTGTN